MYSKEECRRIIDGELNRISVTDDPDEIVKMMGYLMRMINKYADYSIIRIRDNWEKEKNIGDRAEK